MKLRQALRSGEKASRKRVAITVTGVLLFVMVASLHLVSAAYFDEIVRAKALQDELQIELTSNGFTPSAVQHAPGTFGITVENSTLSGSYTLRLKAEDGTILKEIEVQKGSAAWTVSLQAGQYTLTEASHPQWQCRITVQ